MRKIFLASLLLLCSAGCAARRAEPLSPPLPVGTPELALGEKAYMVHCHKCHPGGEKGLGFAVNNKPLPGFLIKAQVRAGAGAMPAFPDELLTGEELEAIVEYIRLLRKETQPVSAAEP